MYGQSESFCREVHEGCYDTQFSSHLLVLEVERPEWSTTFSCLTFYTIKEIFLVFMRFS